jgi:hypothetical protein
VSAPAFTPGLVELLVVNPDVRITVDGYSDGTFGIDRREYFDDDGRTKVAHTITHLRTGGVVRHVKGPLANAKKIAAILHKVPWDFDRPDDCKKQGREAVIGEVNATGLCVASFNVSLTRAALAKVAKARGEQP